MNATATNFASILDKPATDIEKPKPMPAGSYLCVVKGQPRHDKSAKKQTPFVEFTLGFMQALDDVDRDELKEALGDAKLGDKTIKNTCYITEGSAWRIKEFLEHLGLVTEGDASMRQLIEESPGCQVIVNLGHRASEDGKSVFAEIKSTAKAE